jgi:hypothetical protein
MRALWELSGSSLGALWELVAVAGIQFLILFDLVLSGEMVPVSAYQSQIGTNKKCIQSK